MNIKVYRGTHRIGGTITGISTKRTKILIDFGSPYFPIKAFGAAFPDGVVFTHYHGDHAGGLLQLPKEMPAYMGKTAAEIYGLLHLGAGDRLIPYENGVTFRIGDMEITPILTDHSAYDAYMLLIEGEGKRILHTGDFRLHGIRGKQVLSALEKYRGTIDVLITEGTNLSYENPVTVSEESLGKTAEILMERYPYTFVMAAPENIDRLAVMHKAAQAKDAFLCDELQLNILQKAAEDAGRNELSALYKFEGAQPINLQSMPKNFVMAVRDTQAFLPVTDFYSTKYPEKSLFIYSLPKAYLKKHRQRLSSFLEPFPWKVMLHTSGHAAEWALWLTVRTLMPGAVIPVHTENPERLRLGAFQDRIVFLHDGEDFTVP